LSKRARRALIAGIAAVTALVVGAAALGATTLVTQAREKAQRQAAATAAVDAALPRLEAFVAHDTGRAWKSPVVAQVLEDSDFLAKLQDSDGDLPDEPADDNDDTGVTWAAMGLAADPDAYWNASDQGVTDNVVGFYDDHTKTLYVRGTTWSPPVEDTVVHELVHANQDQSFDLGSLMTSTSTINETPDVLQTVVEGEATLVEHDYADTRTSDWRDAVVADSANATGSDVRVADASAAFPYVEGQEFVRRLRELGGTRAVDSAFVSPPRYSRDLADPAAWLAHRLPPVSDVARPLPPQGSKDDVQDYGVLGVRGLWLAVVGSNPDIEIDAVPTLTQLEGWAGDTYVATQTASSDDADRYCFVDDMRFTSAASRARALGFVSAWTGPKHISVSLQGADSVRFSGCTTA
jgi:hypothetical protein